MGFDKIKYDNDYQKQNYDRIILNVPKGKRELIKVHSKAKGYESLNQYLNELIRKDMNENSPNIKVGDINQQGIGNQINIK